MKKIILILFIYFLWLPNSWAIDRFVNPTGNDAGDCTGAACQSITYAIGQALAGDVIIVASGTYSETLIIDKSLRIQGNFSGVDARDGSRGVNESIILNPNTNRADGVLVQIQADNVVLDGLNLNGSSNYVQGIAINGFSNLQIQNCIIENFDTDNDDPSTEMVSAGIWAEGNASNNQIQNNLIQSILNPTPEYTVNDPANIVIPSPDDFLLGHGIYLKDGFYASVQNNGLEDLTIGLRMDNYTIAGTAVLIANNSIDAGLGGVILTNLGPNASAFQVNDNSLVFSNQGLPIVVRVNFGVFTISSNIEVPNSAINLASVANGLSVSNNTLEASFYGYVLYGVAVGSNLVIDGGTISQVCQGVAVLNIDPSGAHAPSTFTLQNVSMSNFQGQAVGDATAQASGALDVFDFHAGVYLFTEGSTPGSANGIQANIFNCNIQGTARVDQSNSAGIYTDDNAPTAQINLNVQNTLINNHQNRGLHLDRVQSAVFNNCSINGNGTADGSSIFRYGIILRANTQNVSFTNCFIQNPAARFCIVGETNVDFSLYGSAITGGTNEIMALEPPRAGNLNFSACWWGSNARPDFLGPGDNEGGTDFSPWLNVGTDTDLITRGFQGNFSFLHVASPTDGVQFGGGRVQEAHDLLLEGGRVELRVANYAESLVVSKNMTLGSGGSATLANLTMNGPGRTLVLSQPLSLSNSLTFNNGVIQNTLSSILSLNNVSSASLTLALPSGNSWVNGYLSRRVNSGSYYTFPMGSVANLENSEIRLNAAAGISSLRAHFEATDPNGIANFIPFNEGGINYGALLPEGYWEFIPDTGTASDYDLNLYPSFISLNEGVIVKHSPPATDWIPDGNPLTLGAGVGRVNLNGFSNFAIAEFNIPLGSQIQYFSWEEEASGLSLAFGLKHYLGKAYLVLDKSLDAEEFKVLSQIENRTFKDGVYIDPDPEEGPCLYRLSLWSESGQILERRLLPYFGEQANELRVYPNPSPDKVHIDLPFSGAYSLEVWSSDGILSYSEQKTGNSFTISRARLSSGVYLLKIKSKFGNYLKRIVLQ